MLFHVEVVVVVVVCCDVVVVVSPTLLGRKCKNEQAKVTIPKRKTSLFAPKRSGKNPPRIGSTPKKGAFVIQKWGLLSIII